MARYAPPVGLWLSYTCPAGQLFDHDWFAEPRIKSECTVRGRWGGTCLHLVLHQEEGTFSKPDWDGMKCIDRKCI